MGGQRAADAIAARQSDLARSHATHAPAIEALQQAAREQLPPALEAELGEELGEREQAECDGFIDDPATVFRFFRRSRYSESAALKLMTESLLWRLRTDLASLSLSSLHPIYVDPPASRPPLFWANPRFVDRYGRPCGVISLRSLERANSESLDECREYIVACMESVRRHLAHVYAREKAARAGSEDAADGTPPPFQMVIAISLLSSGMANLEMELLPFLLDLLKNHFPGMVGAVYVLHYGWVHAGMWGLAKRVLPEQALSRIFFPSNKELAEEHFDPSALPVEFGGDWDVELTEATNDLMRKYAKPTRAAGGPPGSPPVASTRERPALSRTGSFESALDEYHSVGPSPWASRAVTPRPSGPPTPSTEQVGLSMSPAGGHLQMTPKAARKLQHLHMTQSARDSTPTASSSRSRNVSESAGVSPSITPGASTSTSPTIRQKRLRSSSGASAPWGPNGAPSQRRRARNVHFGTSPHESPAASRSHSPVRRVGSLRDFRLTLPGSTPGEGVDPLRAESPDSDHSDSKVTETTKPDETQAKLGFFARWRSSSHGQQTAEADRARAYREQLRSQQAQQAEGSLGEASATAGQASQASPRSAIDEEIERGPSSPRLQVPFIEEPPLSAGIGAGRFLSRRTRKYERVPGVVSPYNASNPFWGYPAYAMNNSAAAAGPSGRPDVNALGIEMGQGAGGEVPQRFDLTTGHARHLHARRRKRDLMRTLAYLFVLRLLSAHRSVRARFIRLYHAVVGVLAFGRRGEAEEGSRRWQEAERRYERLRNAGLRGETETMMRMQQQRALEERKRLQGKPIATLPQKRWLLLLAVLLVVLRRSARERAWRAAAATTHSAHALLRLSASKTAQLSSSSPLASVEAAIRRPRSAAAAAASAAAPTLTGLHLRHRLGLISSS